MLNRIILAGRMVRDAEMRHTASGTPVANFTLAVNHDFKNKETGERGVDFISCIAWRSTAEFLVKYTGKGRLIIVDGRLQMRDWTDKDGNKRTTAEVVAENVYFGDSRRDGNDKHDLPIESVYDAHPDSYSALADNQFSEPEDDSGDLPF